MFHELTFTSLELNFVFASQIRLLIFKPNSLGGLRGGIFWGVPVEGKQSFSQKSGAPLEAKH